MQQLNFTPSQRNIRHLASLLLKRRPEIAEELLHQCPLPEPPEEDINRIPDYFEAYCQVIGLPAEKVQLKINRTAAEHRRIFIAVILRIYHPEVYERPDVYFKPSRGIGRKLRECLKTLGQTYDEIYKVKEFIKVYPDFTRDALNIYSQIKKTEDGSTVGQPVLEA